MGVLESVKYRLEKWLVGISDMYVAQKIDKIEIYLCVEKQVGCTRMEGETRSGHLYRKPL